MNVPLPPAVFPLAAKATGGATFVVAVLVGLALYLNQQGKRAATPAGTKPLT